MNSNSTTSSPSSAKNALLRIAVFHRVFPFASDNLVDGVKFANVTSTWKDALHNYCDDFWQNTLKDRQKPVEIRTANQKKRLVLDDSRYIELVSIFGGVGDTRSRTAVQNHDGNNTHSHVNRDNIWILEALHRQGNLHPLKDFSSRNMPPPIVAAIVQKNYPLLEFLIDEFYTPAANDDADAHSNNNDLRSFIYKKSWNQAFGLAVGTRDTKAIAILKKVTTSESSSSSKNSNSALTAESLAKGVASNNIMIVRGLLDLGAEVKLPPDNNKKFIGNILPPVFLAFHNFMKFEENKNEQEQETAFEIIQLLVKKDPSCLYQQFPLSMSVLTGNDENKEIWKDATPLEVMKRNISPTSDEKMKEFLKMNM